MIVSPMREIKLDEVRLVLDPASIREVKHGRLGRQRTKLKTFKAYVGEAPIGTVELTMVTFEQRTPGRMYVNRRWQSPRWQAQLPIGVGRYSRSHYETKALALESLVWSYNAEVRASAQRQET